MVVLSAAGQGPTDGIEGPTTREGVTIGSDKVEVNVGLLDTGMGETVIVEMLRGVLKVKVKFVEMLEEVPKEDVTFKGVLKVEVTLKAGLKVEVTLKVDVTSLGDGWPRVLESTVTPDVIVR